MNTIQGRIAEIPCKSVAPAWHTVAVLAMMLGVSFVGAQAGSAATLEGHGRALRYVLAMVVEWAIVGFIWWELHRQGIRLSHLVGGRWSRLLDVLRDVGIGIAFVVVFGGAVQVLTSLFNTATPQTVMAMLPRSLLERILWVALGATAGFCEELIFRGYLQRQFAAATRSLSGGVALQAIIFGLSHGYQGWRMMAIISMYGACFGVLAYRRRSLRPGMLGHGLQDTVTGLLAGLLR